MRALVLALTVLGLAVSAPAQQVPDWVTKTTISGAAFGDFYGALAHHDPDVQDRNGFWFRRVYLTVDHRQSSEFSARFRLESFSSGRFTSATADRVIAPFVKDAWLQWQYRPDHGAVLGISETPTVAFIEEFWGYRHLEKTPLDLALFADDRELGLAFQGAWGSGTRWHYHAMLGNGSDTNPGKRVLGSLRVNPGDWVFEAYADYDNRTNESDIWTIQGVVGFTGDWGRAGGLLAHQERQLSATTTLKLDLLSGFVVIALKNDYAIIARIDVHFDPNPLGNDIRYLPMSEDAEPILFLAGFDLPITDTFSIIPNMEVVSYTNPVAGATTPDTDVYLRGTFSWTF